jgi:asparagine synthase (glutamine-hydrolysing)
MSGIFASVGEEPPAGSLASVSHRGARPSGGRTFHCPAVAVHLRWCSDDEPANAPGRRSRAADPREPYAIAWDGRIHNARELRQRGDCGAGEPGDGDLAMDLLARHGTQGLHEINGMFAFIAWDGEAQRLVAARDRFGLKPLYVYKDATRLAFASEIKQFFALPGVAARLNVACGLDFLLGGLTDHTAETMFEGVYRLPAGTTMCLELSRWRPGDPLPPARRWYELPAPGSVDLGEAEAAARFRELFIDAVRIRWPHEAARALCLSGGLDSAAVACAIALEIEGRRNRHEGKALTTFKAFFDDPTYDEPHLFRSVLERTAAVSHACHCGGRDALELVDRLVWHLDEPYSRASLAAQWKLFEQAAGLGIRFTLDGQGADELLAGYRSMVKAYEDYLTGAREGGTPPGGSSRAPGAHSAGAPGRAWLAAEWRAMAERRHPRHPRLPLRDLGELCRDRIYQGDLPMMMRHNDRIGMAHGVETRVPFMDHRVVDLCLGLGSRYKIVNGQTKYLLRRALGQLIPQAVLRSSYKGSYSQLEEGWLRGAIAAELLAAVAETAGEWSGLFDRRGIRRLLRDPARAGKETLMLLWRILCFGAWARRFAVSL